MLWYIIAVLLKSKLSVRLFNCFFLFFSDSLTPDLSPLKSIKDELNKGSGDLVDGEVKKKVGSSIFTKLVKLSVCDF